MLPTLHAAFLSHIIRAILAILIASAYCFFNIEWIFTNIILGPTQNDFISYQYLNKLGTLLHISALQLQDMSIQFQNTELSGQFMMSFSVSFMMGLILSFPFVFWELWKFIRPALKASELRYARGIVFWSSLLFFIGVLFAYYIIAPFTINFFANYQLSPQFKNIITITNYYDTMSDLIMGMGLVFELPVIVYFLSRIGILTPKLMRDKRRYAIVIIFFLAVIISPPDWFSCWLIALPLMLLFEISIGISDRANKARMKKQLIESNNNIYGTFNPITRTLPFEIRNLSSKMG